MRARALAYPDTEEAFPWGERVVKVKGKVFVFMGDALERELLHLSVKLPVTGKAVLKRPYAKPTGYALGKSGWVSLAPGSATIELEEIFRWLDESYRAVAPKTSVAKLDESAAAKGKPAKRKRPA